MAKRAKAQGGGLYEVLRERSHAYDGAEIAEQLSAVSKARVSALAASLSEYIAVNLPNSIARRKGLAGYRTNPYVMLTSASVMKLNKASRFADFLFNNKLYMGLETSFGKSIEAAFVGAYPLSPGTQEKWGDPPEKRAEHQALAGMSNERRARKRTNSIWREVDRSCVVGKRRYLVSIKSGPNCINDTQVEGMKSAIVARHAEWLAQTKQTYPGVKELDVVIGITYGTDKSTNNKDNQILAKLLEHGFVEEDRVNRPGILIDAATRKVRVYRVVGQEFWSFIGRPDAPELASFVYLEVLLALSKALADVAEREEIEESVNRKIVELTGAFESMVFPKNSLPDWIRDELPSNSLFWLAAALTAFFDQGI